MTFLLSCPTSHSQMVLSMYSIEYYYQQEADCNCRPSSAQQKPSAHVSGGSRPSVVLPQRPSFGQIATTRRPTGQAFTPQTTRPFGPLGGQTVPQGRRPSTPSRIGQSPRPVSSPTHTTRTPYGQAGVQPEPENDISSIGDSGIQSVPGQKRPDQTRTRYPTPSRRVPTPRQPSRITPTQPPRDTFRGQQPQPQSDQDRNYPEQEISPTVTPPPRQTDKWSNRQQTQVPRYPTPSRTQQTTRRPQTTRIYNRVTPSVGQQHGREPSAEGIYTTQSPQQDFHTQKPGAGSSWQQRKQVTTTTKRPSQQQPTFRPSRVPPPPQRRPTQPRPATTTLPSISDQSFESNRQNPSCRRRGDRITPSTQNLPVCPESTPDQCQNQPYNPSDPRPLCPNETETPDCRNVNEPYNPSDTRPLCPSPVPEQDCRPFGQPTYVGDRRPLCSSPPPTQTNCKDPSAPYNPADTRPLCRTTSRPQPTPPRPQINPQPNCRRQDETASLGDNRPICPQETQADCRPFLERPQPGDRRPVCRVNQQPPRIPPSQQQRPQPGSHVTKGQQQPRPPQRQPSYPQSGRYPATQTTRRQQWQTTTKPPQEVFEQTDSPNQSQAGRQPPARVASRPYPPPSGTFQTRPQTGTQPGLRPDQPQIVPQSPAVGSSRPLPPPSGTFQTRPQTDTQSGLQPDQPQAVSEPPQSEFGSHPSQPQSGSYPAQPSSGISQPQSPVSRPGSRPSPSGPYTGSRPQPGIGLSPPRSSPPPRGTFTTRPQSGFTQAPPRGTLPAVNQPQTPGRQPSSDVGPGSQIFSPQRQPVVHQGQRTTSRTQYPGRVSTTPRVPISVTGTSTASGEDTRRTLYEIVEDPALLIRGQPVKMTKIFDLFHKAGIENVLTGPGPTTVFLPSDDAFSTLPQGVVDQLEENPELLRQVLLYHVTSTEILPSDQGESYVVPSLEGTQLVITMLNGGRLILISGAKAIAVTRANNGIFYVINQLLYPLPHQNIVGAIQSRPDLSTLAFLLPLSGLMDLLQGQTPYTFLAPTDNAFAQLPPAVYDELTRNTTALQELLLNHITEGAHYGREFLTGGTFPSLRGGKLKFQVVSYGYQVNDVNIKTPEIVTGTGIIHLIDQVLLDEQDLEFITRVENSVSGLGISPENNAQQPPIGGQQPSYGRIPAVGRTPAQGQSVPGQRLGAGQSPSGQIPVTGQHSAVQRPTTGQHSPTGQRPASGQNSPTGQRPATGQHTVRQGLTPGQPQVTGLQPSVGQRQDSGYRSPTGQRPATSQITGSGHTSFGGQITTIHQSRPSGHTSSRGQYPSSGQSSSSGQNEFQPQPLPAGVQGHGGGSSTNVADLARSMGLNKFANWITNTGLLEKIHDGGVYTVFAPTDDAISSLPQEMTYSIDSDPQQVKSLLQYHIIPQSINVNSLTNEETTSTLLQGKTIRFNVYENKHCNCKQMVTASGTPIGDALATMGSVQVIPVTQVLYQPTGNLLNIIEASPILRNLSEAVRTARLTWVLSGTGPMTIFAPSDTAFQSLTQEERKTLIDDKKAFADLLKRHIVRGTYFSSGVQEDQEKKSESGQPLILSLQEGIMTVNSVPVTYSDITALNGVLHVIDQFL
ncbi:Transforming growth factor-beta-induced protein ig-h3, partial [Stegodyphus mimosarum]